jgi:fatty-acyl-CoA synthase
VKTFAKRTLPAMIEAMVERFGDRPAISFDHETITFSEFHARALDFARALHADGVRKGDKVGILMGNRIEWLVVSFAVQYLGATMVALNTWYTAHELSYVLEHGDVSVLVTVDRYLKSDYVNILTTLDPIKSKEFPLFRRIVLLGEMAPSQGWVTYGDYIGSHSNADSSLIQELSHSVAEEDIAYILYTSGSTSRPKGVMLTHHGLVENGFNIGERLHLAQEDVLFLPVSLFWGLGCENAVPAAWTHGVHIVLQHRFEAADALELIERHCCSVVYGTSNITYMLFEHEDATWRDLSRLRKGMAGGSQKIIEDYVPLGCRAYGMTETYGYATVTDASDPVKKRIESMGRPTPGNILRIHSTETGEQVAAGVVGELRIKGHVFVGYYKETEVTNASFDREGFFQTGDLGYFDADGFFYFQGRLKEMIKTGGMNVSPAEVEDVLMLLPQVKEAYVTALPDLVRDQIVGAVLLVAENSEIEEQSVLDHCRRYLATFKVPKHIRFVTRSELPQTTTGKVHKMRLPELFKI